MSYVLLWSQRQNALHVEPLERHLSLNRQAYRDNTGGDYRLLFIGTREEVDQAADAIRNTIRERSYAHNRKVPA